MDLLLTQQPTELALDRFIGLVRGTLLFAGSGAAIYGVGRLVFVPAVSQVMQQVDLDPNIRLPVEKVLKATIGLFALLTGLTVSGFGGVLTATAAITAAATIAIGFASQDVLGNFVSGVFIVTDPKFKIGDWIEWKDKEGIIEDISFRVTRVHTFDNELITVPNAELTTNAVTNPVAKKALRITFEFGVGYDEDLERAKEIIVEEAHANEEILDRPKPSVRIMELAESVVVLKAFFWISNPGRVDFVRVRSDFVQAVKERFDAEDVSMPYPQRELSGAIDTREALASEPLGDWE
ncbi:mechanosensitive ion channel family protein [Halobacteriaceae archaeon GCM10025711]